MSVSTQIRFQEKYCSNIQKCDILTYIKYNLTTERRTEMTQEEKIDAILETVKDMKAQLDKQAEQLDYVVTRLNHMRDKAHAEREKKTAWPK